MRFLWWRRPHQAVVITTTYACGHEQAEDALNFGGYGWCEVCRTVQPVISTQACG